MNRILSLIGLLLLVIGGRGTGRGAEAKHDFGKWEKEIAAYERSDRTNPPPKGAIVFTGASAIRRWTSLTEDFAGYRVLNRGFGGSEIVDVTHFADRILVPYQPRMICF